MKSGNTRCASTTNERWAFWGNIAPLAHVTDVSKGTSGRAAERKFPHNTASSKANQ